jgi:hypothetical protein
MNEPPTPPASVEDLHADTEVSSADIDLDDKAAQPSYTTKLESLGEHLFDWTIRIIGAVCAVLFGIWAPLSYQLQKSGNESNDEEMSRLAKEVKNLNEQMRTMGMLRAFELCEKEDRKDLPACIDLRTSLQIHELIAQLAALPARASSSSTASSKLQRLNTETLGPFIIQASSSTATMDLSDTAPEMTASSFGTLPRLPSGMGEAFLSVTTTPSLLPSLLSSVVSEIASLPPTNTLAMPSPDVIISGLLPTHGIPSAVVINSAPRPVLPSPSRTSTSNISDLNAIYTGVRLHPESHRYIPAFQGVLSWSCTAMVMVIAYAVLLHRTAAKYRKRERVEGM